LTSRYAVLTSPLRSPGPRYAAQAGRRDRVCGPAATRRRNNHPPPKYLHLKDLYLFSTPRARTTPIDFLL
jgi:hypothetical protein